jgi:hypothetical protein
MLNGGIKNGQILEPCRRYYPGRYCLLIRYRIFYSYFSLSCVQGVKNAYFINNRNDPIYPDRRYSGNNKKI